MCFDVCIFHFPSYSSPWGHWAYLHIPLLTLVTKVMQHIISSSPNTDSGDLMAGILLMRTQYLPCHLMDIINELCLKTHVVVIWLVPQKHTFCTLIHQTVIIQSKMSSYGLGIYQNFDTFVYKEYAYKISQELIRHQHIINHLTNTTYLQYPGRSACINSSYLQYCHRIEKNRSDKTWPQCNLWSLPCHKVSWPWKKKTVEWYNLTSFMHSNNLHTSYYSFIREENIPSSF